MNNNERAYWLAWSLIPGVGSLTLKRIQKHFHTLAEAWAASPRNLAEIEGIGEKMVKRIMEVRSQIDPEKLLEEHQQKNPHFWTPVDPEYPQLLREIPNPPAILYYQGQVKLEENQGITPMIAIVGTREHTEHGKRWTRKISVALAQHNFTVVSGMAAGIDGIAHRSCLDAGGRTIAVVGTGLDVVYPREHAKLYEQIQEQGLILSEYPAGTQPHRHNFPQRNRIIAALSQGILVMEAPEKSGALITARYGKEFSREVYSLPNSPDNLKSRGCLRLLHDGAEIIIEEGELLKKLGATQKLELKEELSSQPNPIESLKLAPDLAEVMGAIASSPIPFDLIVQQTGKEAGIVSSILLQLELLGLISQLPGMRYQRN
ncbi:MAG: DNA-processing protein DprA [Gomphosphaeria aponina SAG 52.96 = DSM 107014]|uniref:DNA-processing protein DprA n=1 Tax=Gomphosphaeria aponina SAG 52.96 = DSM 107014 TaxID=1521640 RepID=A0A941GUF3_9CHRO|nr:DNA-processing protein DprA [Gomphosphaeria aponina SAG 52.96 = DSM 107014]